MSAKVGVEKARAEAFASALITEHWDCNIPIDPEGYASRLGLRVEHCENLGLKTGVLDAEHLLIRINAKTAPEHRRFAVALKAMVEVRNVKDPIVLRQAFGVSSQVLHQRLETLGYFL